MQPRLEADEARHQPREDATLEQLHARIDYECQMRDMFANRARETLAQIHKLKRVGAVAAGHHPRTS